MLNVDYNENATTNYDDDIVVERYEYAPYGERTVYISPGSNDPDCHAPTLLPQRVTVAGTAQPYAICEFGHQGLMHDNASGLIYNRRRMLHPRFARYMQRDSLGYVDGMSAYASYKSMRLAVDPMGLEVIMIIDNSKKQQPTSDPYDKTRKITYEEMLRILVKVWNTGIDDAEKAVNDSKHTEFQLNGKDATKEEVLESLRNARMRLVTLPENDEQAIAAIRKIAMEATASDDIILETHSAEAFDVLEASFNVGDERIEVSKINQVFPKGIKARLMFGSCFWTMKEIQVAANRTGTTVAGSPKDEHMIFRAPPDTMVVEKEGDKGKTKALNVYLEKPVDLQTFKKAPQADE